MDPMMPNRLDAAASFIPRKDVQVLNVQHVRRKRRSPTYPNLRICQQLFK